VISFVDERNQSGRRSCCCGEGRKEEGWAYPWLAFNLGRLVRLAEGDERFETRFGSFDVA
jgi:hypothetical protein